MALSFNNTSDNIDLSDRVSSVTDDFSIHCWIKPNLNQQTGCIFYNGDDNGGWGLFAGDAYDSSSNRLVGLFGGVAWLNPGVTLTDDTWVSVGMYRDSGDEYLVKNGSATASAVNAPNTPTSGQASIGMQWNGTPAETRYYDGAIAEVAVWESVLTSQNWTDLAAGALASDIGSPVFYMRLIDDSATVQIGSVTATVDGTTVVDHPPLVSVGGTNMQINIGDSWKDVDSIQINIGDAWKDVDSVQVNIGDAWKDVF